MQNTFAILHGVNDLRLETHPVPELRPNEVLIRMAQVGLCGTDLSMVYKGKLADITIPTPAGVGHEASGVIAKCGKDVSHLKLGDRVCIEPGNPCRSCNFCYTGKYNVCDKSSFYSDVTLYPGCLATYYISRADMVFKLPPEVSDEEGAIIEPLAVALYTCRRSNVSLGSSVFIVGAGPIGLLCLITAKAMGATNILVADINANRLQLAKRMGAHHTLLVESEISSIDMAKKVEQVMGEMPEVTHECSGSVSGFTMGIYATRARGVLVSVGVLPKEATLPLSHAMVREVDIIGIYRYVDCFPAAIAMVAQGLVDVKPLITHRYKFDEYLKAFETFHTASDGAVKCMISCE